MNLIDYLENLSEEEIKSHNEKELLNAELAYTEFKSDFEKGICNTCGESIHTFNPNKFCHHWFLKPKGLKKKHFKTFLKEPIGYFHLETFFRWVANIANPIKAINDIQSEIIGNKLKVITIKYQEIEWTLNYGVGDLKGHSNSIHTNFPHFHIQMTVNGKPYIDFGEFHIPFSREDLTQIHLSLEHPDLINFNFLNGEGMSLFENEETLEELEKYLVPSSNTENAMFNVKTILQMPKGETISEEEIDKVYREAKEKNISIRKLFKLYYPQASFISTYEPGKGVPELKNRKPR